MGSFCKISTRKELYYICHECSGLPTVGTAGANADETPRAAPNEFHGSGVSQLAVLVLYIFVQRVLYHLPRDVDPD